jgi:hypothetical protein
MVHTEPLGFEVLIIIAFKISVVGVQVNLKTYVRFGIHFPS